MRWWVGEKKSIIGIYKIIKQGITAVDLGKMSGKVKRFPPKSRIIAFMAPKVEQVMMIEFKGVTMISSAGNGDWRWNP